MAAITASMVKDLREKTGAGMMDCKTALQENDGDIEAAVDWLRKKGLSKAAKKAGRTAADGLVAYAVDGNKGVVVEVNSETDFVARNEKFQNMVANIADVALSVDGDIEKLKAADYPGAGKSVEDHITEMVGSIGEHMSVRRSASLSVSQGVVVPYVHTQIADQAGKIVVLVALESAGDADALQSVGKQIAMHVAASRPLALSVNDLDATVVEREKSVLAEQARASGKPEQIIDKMVEGRMQKFYEESVLLEQVFVIDGETRIKDVAKNAGAELKGFIRMELGEGVEKEESDFAAEVAAMNKG
ncbi:translation elongation factor Ts [Parvularcula sp. LCG005]|uniref:translation elongation factor Ts n=1 Tax=Parvularcula sp. LCG005 TaxID=3078805 RepID=UPI0029430B93|nr:translation elongation factor Ts [Parvularcula sp. LCG005]WOI52769.1 translation elongation factor Ts [Parvularcula sp. LCG005]